MTNPFDQNTVVVYTGDETRARATLHGVSIMEQMLMSAASVRKNWSTEVEIVFIHTEPLSMATKNELRHLKVLPIDAGRKISAAFPIANKMLVGSAYRGKKDILFLDCDTLVHQAVMLDNSRDMLVTFDALQDVSTAHYRMLYSSLGVELPSGRFSKRPSYDYYHHDCIDQFPLLNTGVYFIKNRFKDVFYGRLETNVHKTYDLFRDQLTFYFDQICFALTMCELKLGFHYCPKGYNFICTKRAPYLKDWPKTQIVIEHYAGNNARPLVFDGNRIDVKESRITD